MTSAGVITLNNDLDVSEGGTGVSTLTSHGILMGNGAGDIQATAEPSNGQILIGKTGDFPQLATITSGVGISVTSAAGAITIDATGAGTAYAEVIDATKAMVVNTSYAANRAGGVAFSLPATSAIGSVVEVIGKDGLWSITQAAGQQIFVSNQNTTLGAGGVLTATHLGDCITLRCITADTIWRAISCIGNLDYA
jgi:hypothetical protein